MAVLGLAKPIKDLAFQLEFTSLAHMVQKLMAYEHYHLDLYQEKFKRHVNMAQADDSDDSAGNKKWLWQNGPGGQTPSHASGSNRRGL